MARREDREYREYLSEEQRRRRGCIARRMQLEFHHGLLGQANGHGLSDDVLDSNTLTGCPQTELEEFAHRAVRRSGHPVGPAPFGWFTRVQPSSPTTDFACQ
jgi:hypothetical protein